MQMRSTIVAPIAAAAEENGPLLREPTRSTKREWPNRFFKMFLFVLLIPGLVIGMLFLSQVTLYGKSTSYSLFSNPWSFCNDTRKPIGNLELTHWVKPESWLRGLPIHHNMFDSELLWLSSMAPRRMGMPIQRVPKVAFMFLTRGPLPLTALWERFFKGHEDLYSIYVHTHPNFKLNVPPSSVFYRRQIPSKEARWGDISMCDAERRLLANALLDFSNERFVLLSETCIPIQPFLTVYNHLVLSNKSFIGAFDDPGPFGRGRYNRKMEPEVSLAAWRKGSQWFEVNRKLANFIVSDTIYYAKFKEFCRPACYVDEHYLPTMLSIQFGSEIAKSSVTWVDWSRGGSHPAMFGRGDVTEEFLTRIKGRPNCVYNGQAGSICFLFARKFSPSTLDPLLRLASKVIGI